MMFKEGAFSGLKTYKIGVKPVYVFDRHQYALPIWTAYSNAFDTAYNLVSIDFHPDTHPGFWQVITLKMTIENREEDTAYFEALLKKKIDGIDRKNLNGIIDTVEELNNDEHIDTAMELGVLKDYHMINCMDQHLYTRGRHYLVGEAFFGSLEDRMFEAIDFQIPEKPLILDIDLDYFMYLSDLRPCHNQTIKTLVGSADVITVARSKKYFEYLKKEDFSIATCEAALIEMLTSFLV